MAVVGACLLCREGQVELQDSHFISKGAYKRVRGKGENRHPLSVQLEGVRQSSKQITAHVFCYACEQRFCLNGETTFFQHCFNGPGQFKLLEILNGLVPQVTAERQDVYALPESMSTIFEQIAYMGVSLFWKSAAYPWKDGNDLVESISLGPYQEQLRLFLLGKALFLSSAALIIEVSPEDNRLIQCFGTPCTAKPPTNHLHWIDICGIWFNLFVGARLPSQIKDVCAFRGGTKYVFLAKDQEMMMARTYRQLLRIVAARHKKENG